MERIIMHIDVNNAFLSWSAVYYLAKGSKIDIRETCAVIGGDENSRRGIVLAKSNPAKKLGIVTGETLYSARKKCKELKTYPMNYSFYQNISWKFFELIKKYTPDIEIASIDECYLDYTGIKNMHGDPYKFAEKLRKEVNEKLKFTINIGIANNKLCAKMASDFEKPNKIHTLYDYEVKEKMWPLPVDDLFTVGKKSAEKLHLMKIDTIGDLANIDPLRLYPFFKNQTNYYINIANGIDESPVNNKEHIYKGISNEITLPYDMNSIEELNEYILSICEKVALRARKQEKYAKTIGVILKDSSFKRKTKQKKLINSTNSTKEIYDMAIKIIKEMDLTEGVRLIGIRLDELTTEHSKQISLFQPYENKDETLDKAVDKIKLKFGTDIIKNAGSIDYYYKN